MIDSNKSLESTPPLFDEVNVNIDGFLDEEPWSKSLFLSKFTSYLPVDGRPAEDDTHIKIWYTSKALYIGITAWEIHDEVRSTLADRDNLENDDYILLFLDTYDDQRSAYAFAVNPIGQQGDGIITDRTTTSRNSTLTFNLDDNPDYVFTSKGRLTDRGYVVEIEIPFKSLRYKKSDIQNWGFNVLRRVQHSGYRSTLFNVNLDVASFLAQSGKLVNISGIDRDKIFEISPEFRTSLQRGPAPEKYKSSSNDLLGVNMRYGLSSNIILNGTVNPDFSQIEADVAQINYDPRRSLFFPEKRPFFLDGIELFRTPTRLIYTRKIANPAAAAKIAGKIGNTTVGLISAADNTGPSIAKIDAAYVNAIRLKRDISDQNHIGLVYTDRIHDDWSNRVFALDGKFIAKDKYSFRAQSGFSVTNSNLESGEIAPMWNIAANASGRKWSSSFSTTAYHGDFNPAVGFVERGDYVTISGGPTRRFYGKEDALLEQLSLSYRLTGNWSYDGFISNDKPDDRRMYPSFSMQFK
ncbi:MAG: carbohydrate binding family 9 domain-containing protein, partial [Candidatus Marinimicrobia bacterium]|nr:carbohydrate binding family 9 domain-containing protein [Candidatus Neomarinimicrobiota bacterium]